MTAITVNGLVKKYGNVCALNGVSLTVEEGELFGLLGVNGAGKTTLIRVLSGLTDADSGEALLLGSAPGEARELIGVSPQETSVAPNLTVKENLFFFAGIYGLSREQAEEKIAGIADQFGLQEVMNKRAKTLSGGWQRRLSIALALVSSPKILFLDEPTLGLDVLARRELWRMIERLRGRITVVLTSHYLEEIEALCGRIAVLSRGELIAVGTAEEIKKQTGTDKFEDAFVALAEGGEL